MNDTLSATVAERKPASAALRLWLWNILLGALLHWRFVRGVDPIGFQATLFLGLGMFSNAFILSLIPALVSAPLSLALRAWPAVRRSLVALVWTLFLTALWLDGNIWGLFRYHFNGMVWATITNPAAGDAVHISTSEFVMTGLGILALFAVQYLALRRLDARALQGFKLSHKVAFLALLIPITLLEKGLYAYADVVRDRRTTAIARVFPVYQRLTIKSLLVKRFGLVLDERPRIDLSGGNILLHYPQTEPEFNADAPRLNIVMIVVDSLRADALTPEVMPRLSALIDDAAIPARVFTNHYSGGNATRFGLFSLLYSLHGSYWITVLAENTPPVLTRALGKLGYEFLVLSTASMNYPEFRSTAWVEMPDRVVDDLPGDGPAEKDLAQVPALVDFLDARATDTPFFIFSLIDSPHQKYSFPADQTPFAPYGEDINYSSLANGASAQEQLELRNAYKNSVYHSDRVLGDMLDALRARGLLENTLVIVTGDHGEELWEHGFFGHTSNFTDVQVRVPFVMLGAGFEPGQENEPTSHLDVVPTLLEMLGADPATRADWSLGENLFDTQAPDRRRFVSGWDLLGLTTPDGILVVPTETHRGLVEGWTLDWQPMIDDDELIKREGAALARLALECSRFLR